jgi:hypothetical protein
MCSKYDRSRTYDIPDDSRVIYTQAGIRVEMIIYYGTNKKPVDISYARYEYLKWLDTRLLLTIHHSQGKGFV